MTREEAVLKVVSGELTEKQAVDILVKQDPVLRALTVARNVLLGAGLLGMLVLWLVSP